MSCGKAVQDSHLPEVALEHRLSGGQIEEPEGQQFRGEVLQRHRRVHAGVVATVGPIHCWSATSVLRGKPAACGDLRSTSNWRPKRPTRPAADGT